MTFEDFLPRFFGLFTTKSFGGKDYLSYLSKPASQRSGDEASVVDTALIGPLLELLGFEPAEQVYNQQRQNNRPDFAPHDPLYGTCFVVEDKSTSLDLDLDISDSDSHLSQLLRYLQRMGIPLGWLTNGRRFTAWRASNPKQPHCFIDFEISTAIQEWTQNSPPTISPSIDKALHDLFDIYSRASFADLEKLAKEIGVSEEDWNQQALPLGTGSGNEDTLVETVQSLVAELQRDARRSLDQHLRQYDDLTHKISLLSDDATRPALEELKTLRTKALDALNQSVIMLGLEPSDSVAIATVLHSLEADATTYANPQAVIAEILTLINAARARKYAGQPKLAQPWNNLDTLSLVRDELKSYSEMAFVWHERRATLRHKYRAFLSVSEDYRTWTSLVRETMLGGLSEDEQRDEFALQAAYVVFIRLLLVRVCEDKGVFPHRMLSDGGLAHWQEDIKRYLTFANGNPYAPLLDMAYANAQNIYAHFFSGRDLFNWFRLDERGVLMVLHKLNRFNFAGVDSDIVGKIYGTYITREEKRNKGQYYTPPEVVAYILDRVGYKGSGPIGSNKRVIDPACGSGSFLVTAAKRLVAAYKAGDERVEDPVAVLDRVRNMLFGFDLNPFACYLAEVNLLIQVLDLVKLAHDKGQRPKIDRFHIYNVDALSRSTGTRLYLRLNTLMAAESDVVDQIKARSPGTPYAQGFAFVVANPPYGARLSDPYKAMLREEWGDVFYGQPDTYVFFMKLGLELLATGGRLGYITPNTYLMGTHTAKLREALLGAGVVEEIVDLPQGIWRDANVDCVLLFLKEEADDAARKGQVAHIHLMGLRDTLDKLTQQDWVETVTQPQAAWLADPRHEMNIRHDALLQQIEDACLIPTHNGSTKVLRLGDVTGSSQGIIPYKTKADGAANLYIKPERDVPSGKADWKPLLDGRAYIGRYEQRWGPDRPYLKYGDWLGRERERKYFDSPKLLVQYIQNRALKRRLVATYDDTGFYNRHNFSNIIAEDPAYDLKYILALFNSSLLNYWFARLNDNVNINPSYFRQLPIYPANAEQQAEIVSLVDKLLEKKAEMNGLREGGYIIKARKDGGVGITVPYDEMLAEMQRENPNFPVQTLFDARATGVFSIPSQCDLAAPISSNIFIPPKHPTTVVLRHNKLWLDVPDEGARRYLAGYLAQASWRGKTWDEVKSIAIIPEAQVLSRFFAVVEEKVRDIRTLYAEIEHLDAEIDRIVVDLYGISDAKSRGRILASAPPDAEESVEAAEQAESDMEEAGAGQGPEAD